MEKLNIKNAGVIEYELLNDLDEKTRYIAHFLVGIIKFIANQSVDYYGMLFSIFRLGNLPISFR